MFRPSIFVSYAHEDSRWFEKGSLMSRLIPSLERRENAEVWYDKGRIGGADIWREEIDNAIDRANIAILLVSQYFLNSDFIMRVELPRLVKRAEEKQLVIFPILVGYCDWESVEALSRPQIMPGEPTPLVEYLEPLAKWERVQYEILQALLRQLEKLRKEPEPPNAVSPPTPEPPSPESIPKPALEPKPPEALTQPKPKPPPELVAQPKQGRVSLDLELVIFAKDAICFSVGAKDSDVLSFTYAAGTAVQYSKKGMDGGAPWYQVRGVGGKDMWLVVGRLGGRPMSGYQWQTVSVTDTRVFFRIVETGQVGYLVDILGFRDCSLGSAEGIDVADEQMGDVKIPTDQITSITAKQGRILVKTNDIGTYSGSLRNLANYDPYHSARSFTMGPCLVTHDAVIALVRTKRIDAFTLKRIAPLERPPLIPELVYWDRSQLKFRVPAREAVGYFDERVRDSYIHFAEQSLGWMRISIPQIRRLTVDGERKEAPVVVETFAGKVYRGVCPEQLNLSGVMISFDRVKNLVLEAFDREAVFDT
jgi:hypothetical protein